MSFTSRRPAPRTPARPADWVKVAARPGSGVGLLPAALSVQPLATILTLGLAATLAAAAKGLRLGPRR